MCVCLVWENFFFFFFIYIYICFLFSRRSRRRPASRVLRTSRSNVANSDIEMQQLGSQQSQDTDQVVFSEGTSSRTSEFSASPNLQQNNPNQENKILPPLHRPVKESETSEKLLPIHTVMNQNPSEQVK
jgi:hypothetical protein